LFSILYLILRGLLRLPSAGNDRELEILVLRHQIKVLARKAGPPKLRRLDRVFLSAAAGTLSRDRWSSFLVSPATLLRWHRESFGASPATTDESQVRLDIPAPLFHDGAWVRAASS
jgi:hypothetical protein